MKIFDAIIQGIIQGVTEFLPVSSSGHLAISQYFLGINNENNLLFNICLHLGTLFSVLFVYRKIILKLIIGFFEFFKNYEKNKYQKLIINLIIALFPLFFLFVPIPKIKNLKSLASSLADSGTLLPIGISLIFTSILILIGFLCSKHSDKRKKNIFEINAKNSFLIGFGQMLAAVFPGLSRSGSTLSIGLMQSIDKKSAIDFSFILGIPAIIAASVLEFKEALETGIKIEFIPTIIGMLIAAITGFLSIKLFKWLVSSNKLWVFSIYTFILGLIIIIFR
jgi:undecaprenyl-diphosphatase